MGNINAETPAILLYNYAHSKVGLKNHELSSKNDILEFIQEKTAQ